MKNIQNYQEFLSEGLTQKEVKKIENTAKDIAKTLQAGQKIIIHKPGIKGEGINIPVEFVKYKPLWKWVVVKEGDKEHRVDILQDPTREKGLSIEILK